MKDYYKILDIPENATQEDIKRAFRKLAFKYHPDTNPGNEKQAEEKFKELNEAFGVLGDAERRRQYDFARKNQFAGVGYQPGGFQYSQQDIFRNIFNSQELFAELARFYRQAGLRFDSDFINRVYFGGGQAFVYTYTTRPNGNAPLEQTTAVYKPGLVERTLSKIAVKLTKFVLTRAFGLKFESPANTNLDLNTELIISSEEATRGGEKRVIYKQGKKTRKLMVKIPPGIESGTRIKLKGMGLTANKESGDLYLHVKIQDN